MAPPEITKEQREAALLKAGEVRRVRAETKELLKMGSLGFSELLAKADEDDMYAGMKIASVLPSLPGMGKVKAKRLMEELQIADNRRLRGLGDRQRQALLERLA
ncbi:MAG: integration host factor [Acidimicrobiia bacterium]|nr:integration host factor [Acidimicrobiia bacterium]MDH5505430.1 integration host factor [Acidimicrobiia bacterium]